MATRVVAAVPAVTPHLRRSSCSERQAAASAALRIASRWCASTCRLAYASVWCAAVDASTRLAGTVQLEPQSPRS